MVMTVVIVIIGDCLHTHGLAYICTVIMAISIRPVEAGFLLLR